MIGASDPLRLLFLLPFAPRLDAAHGGGRVMAQFLWAMTSRHPVAVVYLRGQEEPGMGAEFRDRLELVEEVPRPWTGSAPGQQRVRAARLLASLAIGRPLWVSDWASPDFGKRARRAAQSFRPGIVQLEYHVMGQYLPWLKEIPAARVLVEHETGRRAAPYIRQAPAAVQLLLHMLDRRLWLRYEAAILRMVQATVVFTPEDRQALAEYGLATPVHCIPFGAAVPEQPLNPRGGSPLSLVFVGNFVHPPNALAALRLARDIYPGLRSRFPELALFIVGDRPPPALQELAGEQLFVTGWAPDVSPYLERAAVFVAPLASGGGMRVKVAEALAAGKAVVATPLAAQGLGVADGEQICLADSNEAMVARIAGLLENPQWRERLGRSAHAWAVEHLSWDQTVRKYEALYRSLLDRRSTNGG